MKWEYTIITIPCDLRTKERDFRLLGNGGWELVSVDDGVAYFKRPKPLTEEQLREMFLSHNRYKESVEGYFGGKVG